MPRWRCSTSSTPRSATATARWPIAQDVHTEFLAAGRPGDRLEAEGVEVHRSNRTAVYRIEATRAGRPAGRHRAGAGVPHRPAVVGGAGMTAFPFATMPTPPVAVVGLGQLGGSLAAALVAAGREVSGWDVDPAARDAAAARGVTITQELAGVVVLAVPLPAMATALDGLTIDPDATVTDLGSVKRPVVAHAGGRVRRPVRRRPPDVRHRALRPRRRRPRAVRRRPLGALPGAGHRAAALAAGGRGRPGRRRGGRAGHRRASTTTPSRRSATSRTCWPPPSPRPPPRPARWRSRWPRAASATAPG